MMTDEAKTAPLPACEAADEKLDRLAKTVGEHIDSETTTMASMQSTMQAILDATNATRSEGRTRGERQDRAVEMVSAQVQTLGTTIAKVDERVGRVEKSVVAVVRRVDDIEAERSGITKQISEHEINVDAAIIGEQAKVQTLDDKVDSLVSNIGDLRLAVGAVTSALSLSVPRADGSTPPAAKLGVLDVIKRDNRAGVVATIIVAAVLAAQQLWPVLFPAVPK